MVRVTTIKLYCVLGFLKFLCLISCPTDILVRLYYIRTIDKNHFYCKLWMEITMIELSSTIDFVSKWKMLYQVEVVLNLLY